MLLRGLKVSKPISARNVLWGIYWDLHSKLTRDSESTKEIFEMIDKRLQQFRKFPHGCPKKNEKRTEYYILFD